MPEDPSEVLAKGLLILQTDVKMIAASLEDRRFSLCYLDLRLDKVSGG